MLTTAELGHPQFGAVVRGLTQEQRDTVYSNVVRADEQFGADTLRDATLESLKVLGKAS